MHWQLSKALPTNTQRVKEAEMKKTYMLPVAEISPLEINDMITASDDQPWAEDLDWELYN